MGIQKSKKCEAQKRTENSERKKDMNEKIRVKKTSE